MARRAAIKGPTPVDAITHDDTRTNIPTADAAGTFYDETRDALPPVPFDRRDPTLDPQLVWRGKFDDGDDEMLVDAPPIYIQEKIDPRVLIENLRRSPAAERAQRAEAPAPTMFDFSDYDELDELSQVEFYQHQESWKNRMILGDSLQVMGSLAGREQLRGKVQMIYLDPPYGIKFGSNWQVSARKRDVKDGKLEDAAREAEQIKAFRDTWEFGIHSYLSYLRDRLVVARDLLTESGSVFVQIGDENVHLVRSLLDEVFGSENFVATVDFKKTGGFTSSALPRNFDYVHWYAKDATAVKFQRLYAPVLPEPEDTAFYDYVEDAAGCRRALNASEKRAPRSLVGRLIARNPLISDGETADGGFIIDFEGQDYHPAAGNHWKTNRAGVDKLQAARRLIVKGNTLRFVRYWDDFAVDTIGSVWADTVTGGFRGDDRLYVVQTITKVIERCMLMTTDPGDLVLDPTCGSGTTAYVAEQWGRRWITVDTSRVALALARQRLMGGRFPYYLLADSAEGRKKEGQLSSTAIDPQGAGNDIRHGFVCERVQHITLKSIANNPDIHEGMTRDEIDAAIKRHADFEYLYDKPYEDKKRVRVTGPFTVESLSPHRSLTFDDAEAFLPASDDTLDDAQFEKSILDNLQRAGIQNGRKAERIHFASLDAYAGTHVQAIGDRRSGDEPSAGAASSRIAIAIGPQYGTVSPGFIKRAAREAIADSEVDLLCVLGFSFDPLATNVTEDDGVTVVDAGDGFATVEGERDLGRIKVLLVRMNADLLMGEQLKKTGAGNLFTVFGEPDIEVSEVDGGRLQVALHGVDVYDPTTSDVRSVGTERIALWMIDTDYNEESFFVRHCYFTGGNDPYKKLKTALKADINADAWAQLNRDVSMPFDRPSSGKIAVKVINDYGDEVMKVIEV
ncbi:site-specific DNA-methyltransferase [Rathayibacter soli]|uniref:site-specific DNA-methyltransferase n=1 Tax=Rathayibacter soli TaxID=3144168 RepID=UPI0027E3E85A|nr:site-specific DNA-methyltransferase [Glaciibacter superstes]